MADHPAYVILGRGRWAQRMNVVLRGELRHVRILVETRRQPQESHEEYRSRLSEGIRASGAQVAWLCVPPGDHISTMLEAVLEAKVHAVIEPPWMLDIQQTTAWANRFRSNGQIIGVHYEYCFLDRLKEWETEYRSGDHFRFGGVFRHSRRDQLGLPAMDVLGTHLLSIRECAVPNAAVGQIECGYERSDVRRVWLDSGQRRVAEIDFTYSREPLIQRYVARLEAAIVDGNFAFGLEFATRVVNSAEKAKHDLVEKQG